jgi:hypothetical protein
LKNLNLNVLSNIIPNRKEARVEHQFPHPPIPLDPPLPKNRLSSVGEWIFSLELNGIFSPEQIWVDLGHFFEVSDIIYF